MRYAFFLGCTIPARARNYELSARRVAEVLDIELVDEERFVCCGFPIKGSDQVSAQVLGAYNFALAAQLGLDICALCSSYVSALTEVCFHLEGPENLERQKVNERLRRLGGQYNGGAKVKHFARILYEEVGAEKIQKTLTKDLSGLRIAVHYGCHYLKPSELYGGL